MQNQSRQHTAPAFLKGALWFLFSGTAMLCAFILPIHFLALSNGYRLRQDLPFIKLYGAILLLAALYHGLYRTATVVFDLGFIKKHHLIEKALVCLFIATGIGMILIL